MGVGVNDPGHRNQTICRDLAAASFFDPAHSDNATIVKREVRAATRQAGAVHDDRVAYHAVEQRCPPT